MHDTLPQPPAVHPRYILQAFALAQQYRSNSNQWDSIGLQTASKHVNVNSDVYACKLLETGAQGQFLLANEMSGRERKLRQLAILRFPPFPPVGDLMLLLKRTQGREALLTYAVSTYKYSVACDQCQRGTQHGIPVCVPALFFDGVEACAGCRGHPRTCTWSNIPQTLARKTDSPLPAAGFIFSEDAVVEFLPRPRGLPPSTSAQSLNSNASSRASNTSQKSGISMRTVDAQNLLDAISNRDMAGLTMFVQRFPRVSVPPNLLNALSGVPSQTLQAASARGLSPYTGLSDTGRVAIARVDRELANLAKLDSNQVLNETVAIDRNTYLVSDNHYTELIAYRRVHGIQVPGRRISLPPVSDFIGHQLNFMRDGRLRMRRFGRDPSVYWNPHEQNWEDDNGTYVDLVSLSARPANTVTGNAPSGNASAGNAPTLGSQTSGPPNSPRHPRSGGGSQRPGPY